MRFTPLIVLTAVTAIAIATPAAAKTESFHATLNGTAIPTTTGSPAHGRVTIKVDTKSQRVSVELDVQGITLDQLNDALVAKPIGPVHFHQYRTADDVEAVLPVPYGANYRATKTGFHVSMRNYAYAEGAKLLNDQDTFEEFVDALNAGKIVINIHTDKFPDGEISGKVMPN
ncbi:CHRD domain-containing protein [Sphingomonas asaccharolytica]|uniref:CHRD domain-containing protein n=1 Tax=Sphingomonas asaccharolytica TaxID=40681 RepID=UPI00082EF5AA|nr:CHRD domain-containing protein [Sphingomonas asaccharolytica]